MRALVILFFFMRLISGQENNVCKTVLDYHTIRTNPNCWYDYETGATSPEVFRKSGRPFETHKIITPDGYVLTMFRLTNQNSRTKMPNPVFLQHGLMCSSDNWIGLGNDSLAFLLNDQGYDVWMGNYRGNRYSTGHVRYSIHDEKFWDHGVDELALIDIPSMLNTISNATEHRSKIIYVGHSLGCALALMYSTQFPDEAQKLIKFMTLAAPGYVLPGTTSTLTPLVPFSDLGMIIINTLGLVNIVSNEKILQGMTRLICLSSPEMMATCASAGFLVEGPKTGVKPEQYPNLLMQIPAGTSIKVVKHILDIIKHGFRKYDHGINNFKIYGTSEPPSYNVTKITVPTVVIYAKNDMLTTKADSLRLYADLAEESRYGIKEVADDNFNHVDFLFGSTSKKVFVELVLKIFEEYQDI